MRILYNATRLRVAVFIFTDMKKLFSFPIISKFNQLIKTVVLLCAYSLIAKNVFPQTSQGTDSTRLNYSDSLIQLIQKGPDDSIRTAANEVFIDLLLSSLKKPGSFFDNFDSLKNLSIQKSPDERFKVYTWTVPKYDGTAYSYFGFLQLKTKNNDFKLFPLTDSSNFILKPESEKLSSDRWLGCIYYKIIESRKAGRTYYTLLGWKAKNNTTSQKLIEVIYFDRDVPKMGFPLFKTGKVFRNRVVFTFLAGISMSLKYEERKKLIVFDHLTGSSSGDGSVPGGPDGTYDAFKFKSGRWLLLNDIDIRSTWKPRKDVPKPLEQGDK